MCFAVATIRDTEFSAALIDGVYCEDGACPNALFNFCDQTHGELYLSNVFARESDYVLCHAGSADVHLENCRVQTVRKAITSASFLSD